MVLSLFFFCYLKINLTDLKLRNYEERFSEDDVEDAFMYLLKMLEALWSGVDISELKKVCIRDIRLSKELKNNLKDAINLDETFDLLSDSPFCSWLEITILERMAKTAEVPEALQLIKTFKERVHRRKCSEIKWLHFNKHYINPDHLEHVYTKLNKNAESLMVADLINYCHKLESILGLSAGSNTPNNYHKGCLEICFDIPTYCCLHAYETARINFYKFRAIHIQYLQVGTFPKIYTTNLTEKESAKCTLEKISSVSNCKLPYLRTYVCTCSVQLRTYIYKHYYYDIYNDI